MIASDSGDDSSTLGDATNEVSGRVEGAVVQAHSIDRVTITGSLKSVTPMELPPAPRQFVNRSSELGAITSAVTRQSCDSGAAVIILSGLAGVGKTALGLQWAYSVRDRFPDGRFYVDLAGYRHRAGVQISDILSTLLLAWGVHQQYLPAELPARAAMWRSHTARSRILLVLDNVDQATEARPLRPNSSGSVVLITSRRRLRGLVVDGAELIEIPPLAREDSSELISRLVRDGRPASERQAVNQLVDQCGGLPVALRVAAARLVQHRKWSISKLVTHLTDEQCRLTRLSVEEEPAVSVSHVFDVAYRALPSDARMLYSCLGLHPGLEMGVSPIARAMGLATNAIEDVLDNLCQANLVDDLGNERYKLHDLVRLHARETAMRDMTESQRTQLMQSIVEWYLVGAMAADRAVMGQARWRLASRELADWSDTFNPMTGMRWLETERLNLLAAVRFAAHEGWTEMVWQFCEALWALYYSRKYYTDWVESHQFGIQAAIDLGAHSVEARLRHQLARAFIELRQFKEAQSELESAWKAANRAAERQPAASVLESLGVLFREQHLYRDALEKFQGSQQVNDELGNKRGGAMQRYHIGDVLVRTAQPIEAISPLTQAVTTFAELHDELALAKARIALGIAFKAVERWDAARQVLMDAAVVLHSREQPVKEAQAWEALAHLAYSRCDESLFATAAARLASLYEDLASPRTERARRWMTGGIEAASTDLQ